ncbi:MAG: hypothetical protein ACR2RE_25860 [Geminicoccaceae bacterium]
MVHVSFVMTVVSGQTTFGPWRKVGLDADAGDHQPERVDQDLRGVRIDEGGAEIGSLALAAPPLAFLE